MGLKTNDIFMKMIRVNPKNRYKSTRHLHAKSPTPLHWIDLFADTEL